MASSPFHMPTAFTGRARAAAGTARPDTRAWLVLAAMTAATALAMIDMSVVVVALPTIDAELGLSDLQMRWVVNAYLLAFTVLVATAGRIADIVGATRALTAGLVGFMGFSVMAGLAESPQMLIGARAGQGAAVAFVAPTAISIAVAAFPADWSGRVAGFLSSAAIVFGAMAPLVGGALTEIDWRLCFFVNLPVGTAALAGLLALRPGRRPARRRGVDWPGFVLFTAGVLLLVLPLMQVGTGTSPLLLAAGVAAGAGVLALFLRTERDRPDAMVDLALLRQGGFLADIGGKLFIELALKGLVVVLPVYFQVTLGLDPVQAGLAFLPSTLPMLVAPAIGGMMFDRMGGRLPSALGAAIGAAGLAWLAAATGQDSYWPFVPGQVLIGVGIGLAYAATTADGLARAPVSEHNAALGLMKTTGMLGGLIGVALIGAVASGAAGGTAEALALSAAAMAVGAVVLAAGLRPQAGPAGRAGSPRSSARSTV